MKGSFLFFVNSYIYFVEKGDDIVERKPKILIITASFGSGHNQVANVILETFKSKGIHDIQIHDLFKEAYPHANEMVRFLHVHSFRFGSPFYQLFYYGTNKLSIYNFRRWYVTLGKRKLEEIIEKEKPDIIINTFPVLTVPYVKKKKNKDLQIYTVITDYCLHHVWIHPEINAYYVATDSMKNKLLTNNVPNEKIVVSGIPIRKAFEEQQDICQLRQKYNLKEEKKTALLIAGITFPSKKIKGFVHSYFEHFQEQLIVVCGTKEKLYKEMIELEKMYPHLRVLCYVQHIHELYEVADIMITKPGGITLTESITKQLPSILFKPVPGQEKENALFFEEKGASVVVSSTSELFKKIETLFQNDDELCKMKQALCSLRQMQSNEIIVEDILRKFKHSYQV